MFRICSVAAPLLLLLYGVARFLDGLDGTHGPGPAWTIGHLFFLASLVLFGLILVGLRRRIGTVWALLATGASLVGLIAFVRVVVVDLVVGLRAADRAEMSVLFDRYETIADTVLDPLAPLFPVGLAVLLTLLAVAGRVPFWSPLLTVLGFVAITVNLDLLPLGALLLIGALAPLARADGSHGPDSRGSDSHGSDSHGSGSLVGRRASLGHEASRR